MYNDPAAGGVIKHSLHVVCQENLPRHTKTTDRPKWYTRLIPNSETQTLHRRFVQAFLRDNQYLKNTSQEKYVESASVK